MSSDLTQGPVSGHLRRQAAPMALGLIAIISFDAVDLFFVSRLGDAHLAAISFCFPVLWLLTSVIIGFEAGAASTVSRAVGKKDDGRRRLIQCSFPKADPMIPQTPWVNSFYRQL